MTAAIQKLSRLTLCSWLFKTPNLPHPPWLDVAMCVISQPFLFKPSSKFSPALGLSLTLSWPGYNSLCPSTAFAMPSCAPLCPVNPVLSTKFLRSTLGFKWQEIMSFKCQLFQEKREFLNMCFDPNFFPLFVSNNIRSYNFNELEIYFQSWKIFQPTQRSPSFKKYQEMQTLALENTTNTSNEKQLFLYFSMMINCLSLPFKVYWCFNWNFTIDLEAFLSTIYQILDILKSLGDRKTKTQVSQLSTKWESRTCPHRSSTVRYIHHLTCATLDAVPAHWRNRETMWTQESNKEEKTGKPN